MSTIADTMSASSLAEALFPRTRRNVLQHLSESQDGLHLRELERRTGVNSRHLQRELHSLRDAGLLMAKKAGNQVIYRLNPDCPIVDEIRAIVRKTLGLAGLLRQALEPLSAKIDLAYVYGSLAQGQERPDSDLDLMIVGDVSLREISPLLTEAHRAIQREISPTLYRSAEYAEALRDPESFVRRVHDGPKILLIGGDA
ncbi:nucleotidyltransferase domain-containing protein [Candidatus Bipolaricaulota bacterium]